MNAPLDPIPPVDVVATPTMRQQLQTLVETTRPQTPDEFAARLFHEKWGHDIDPQTAMLVTLDYDYKGHPPHHDIHQGQVANSRTLLQALLGNYQTVGDGRFAETAFGLYTPPDVGPTVRIVEHVDQFADRGSGNHRTYEGIYRKTLPQVYGPQTQIALRPADFKKWVWTLELKELYQDYLARLWPSNAVIRGSAAYPFRTSVKAAFVMSAWLQFHENSLTGQGLALALQAAGLPAQQTWETLTLAQLQAPTRVPALLKAGRLQVYRYTATDIWTYLERGGSKVLLYIPGNSSPFHEFDNDARLHDWLVRQAKTDDTKLALANHFAEADRTDGTFHAGVLTALDGVAIYPKLHRLSKTAGFFNNDGFWDPADYIGFQPVAPATDPFAQLVLSMKWAAQASADTIRDDAQVNRDDLSAVVEPIVQWINRFAPLALFVPGGEGLLALAGLIDAGFGLERTIEGETAAQRSEGLTRTIFGLLNALPLATAAVHATETVEVLEQGLPPKEVASEPADTPVIEPMAVAPPATMPVTALSRLELMRGMGPSVSGFSDETLGRIGRVCAVDDDMLRLINEGRAPTPLLADTISRFRLDQTLESMTGTERTALFNARYQALQQSDNAWIQLFQQQYPQLPKSTVEQMLDRYGVDLHATPDAAAAKRLFSRLDGKARHYQQHVRLNRSYEGLYLRSMSHPDSDTLALHSLPNVPGWPQGIRIEMLDASLNGRVLDRCGALEATDVRRLIKTPGNRYQMPGVATDSSFCAALLDVLSESERAALQLPVANPLQALQRTLAENALSRTELIVGLERMDTGLPFEWQGLRGGGFPTTPQGATLTQGTVRLQLSDLYPEFTEAQLDGWLQRFGANAQARLSVLRLQFEQLGADLNSWIELAVQDADDMDIEFLALGDEEAEGMSQEQIRQHNITLLQDAIKDQKVMRRELAAELIALWQKRPPTYSLINDGETLMGYRLDLDFEEFHRLPVMSVRFDDVIDLSMRGVQLIERETLNPFLESFPRLRVLSLGGVDLRLPDAAGELQPSLPPAIAGLKHLTTLNLKATLLAFRENTASQLCELSNLRTLDLSENPLGIPPVLLGMDQLREVNLRNTGIASCPIGIRDQPYLTKLDLRDNLISRVPPAIIKQAVAQDRVQLWGNPLTDEDTLKRLIDYRQRTGINLWLSKPGPDYGEVTGWLTGLDEQQRSARSAIWQRLAARPSGARFLRTMDGLSLTPDYRVDFPELQARVWRLLGETDASDELWGRMSRDVEVADDDAENPMALLTVLENRAKSYRDWVALGGPFPLTEN